MLARAAGRVPHPWCRPSEGRVCLGISYLGPSGADFGTCEGPSAPLVPDRQMGCSASRPSFATLTPDTTVSKRPFTNKKQKPSNLKVAEETRRRSDAKLNLALQIALR